MPAVVRSIGGAVRPPPGADDGGDGVWANTGATATTKVTAMAAPKLTRRNRSCTMTRILLFGRSSLSARAGALATGGLGCCATQNPARPGDSEEPHRTRIRETARLDAIDQGASDVPRTSQRGTVQPS